MPSDEGKVQCSRSIPSACAGCEKVGRRCYVDPTFKRTAKRSQKSDDGCSQGQQRTHHSAVACGSSAEQTGDSAAPEMSVTGSEDSLDHLLANLRCNTAMPETFTDESKSIQVDSSTIADLLEEYYLQYHSQFPLLHDPAAVIESYEKCPALFWITVAIACKRYEKHLHLYSPLQNLVKRLVADHIVFGTRSIYLVHALLLLCVWPFPHAKMNKDTSSNYCGLAISMAKSLGLHRPKHPFRFFMASDVEIGDVDARTRTWLACFIIDQWHTARFGVPAILRADYTIIHSLNGHVPWLPGVMENQLRIASVTSKISIALGECETESTGLTHAPLALVRMLDTELNVLQERYSETWSPATEISFLDARLALYSYILAQDPPESRTASHQRQAPSSEFVTLGSLTAIQLLLVVSSSPQTLTRGTFHTFRSVSYAMFFLLRLGATVPKDLIHKTAVRNAISQVWPLMKDTSQTDTDQWARMCAIIENVTDCEDWTCSDRHTPSPGNAKSFMANNFISDIAVRGILKARRQYKAACEQRDADRDRDENGEGVVSVSDLDLNFDFNFAMWENLFGVDDQLPMW